MKLVKRIPLGLEIPGLREGLSRMLREYEVQESISEGVARVLRGEVNTAMKQKGEEQKRGVRFDVAPVEKALERQEKKKHHPPKVVRPGFCAGCDDVIRETGTYSAVLLHRYVTFADYQVGKDLLVGFPCSHIFHLPCLLRYEKEEDYELPGVLSSFGNYDDAFDSGYDRSIGPKVDHAALLRTFIEGGCPVPMHHADANG